MMKSLSIVTFGVMYSVNSLALYMWILTSAHIPVLSKAEYCSWPANVINAYSSWFHPSSHAAAAASQYTCVRIQRRLRPVFGNSCLREVSRYPSRACRILLWFHSHYCCMMGWGWVEVWSCRTSPLMVSWAVGLEESSWGCEHLSGWCWALTRSSVGGWAPV